MNELNSFEGISSTDLDSPFNVENSQSSEVLFGFLFLIFLFLILYEVLD